MCEALLAIYVQCKTASRFRGASPKLFAVKDLAAMHPHTCIGIHLGIQDQYIDVLTCIMNGGGGEAQRVQQGLGFWPQYQPTSRKVLQVFKHPSHQVCPHMSSPPPLPSPPRDMTWSRPP